MSYSEENLVWIDLEMTGLDPEMNTIIEIATIVTDKHLNVLAQGPNLVVHQDKGVMDAMDEWCTTHHGQSGLTQRVLDSAITMEQAEQETIAFLEKYLPAGKSPICGNSVGQDRRFLYKYMPRLEAFFHYRYIDVSTLKELGRRWKPEALDGFTKTGAHLALDDILESIGELKHYRKTLFGME
ncbi:oligoribonuclease [Marinomonas mediterranea]|uniref:Oligoribonuclease n=1 Tax=Marinomonas mediterranea (strain ATCC 700492 / JCM 21426 / NBRC 103028 / MMB-1) TaxID=717774 RepID=F2JWM2_MARM1|nr:oligoribonuclease [Marinomonas mediterranea]ADZ91786.1 Oligoribonuclease [Marinomonas mediterranea MMB-1]WCN09742.1 oligoribonuclease [Marinomonas mediterranea]WCN13823.1 oligoribonuclease [Marinomonas mediterranea]WCN17879.1 oligoribonuclease [Marinomonas mediterranea MMB-1]